MLAVITCPYCGHEITVSPGSLMRSLRKTENELTSKQASKLGKLSGKARRKNGTKRY